jgi:hypothetical protein
MLSHRVSNPRSSGLWHPTTLLFRYSLCLTVDILALIFMYTVVLYRFETWALTFREEHRQVAEEHIWTEER